ncbi:hypothetical protein AcV7_007103 [Taiwanofungus camphoratus]|nr:hypothetical protein AcV7_007103 [Antrodia cinnamomea]
MDPANDVMLVFGQNGRVLHPNHGNIRSMTVVYYAQYVFIRIQPVINSQYSVTEALLSSWTDQVEDVLWWRFIYTFGGRFHTYQVVSCPPWLRHNERVVIAL